MTASKQKTGSGALFLCPSTQRVMLSLRAPHKTHSMNWSVWGGMHEGNETPKECLIREMQEEMGNVPEIGKFYPFDIYESRDKHFKYYTFVCIVDEEFIPELNDENIGYPAYKSRCFLFVSNRNNQSSDPTSAVIGLFFRPNSISLIESSQNKLDGHSFKS